MKRVGSLDIDQDLDFQKREWALERVGWLAIALVILLALIGFAGDGPISLQDQRSPDSGLEIRYQRYVRAQNPTRLTIRFPEQAAGSEQVRVFVDRQYLGNFQIEDISPSPDQTIVAGEQMIYVFNVGGAGQAVEVGFDLTPQTAGQQNGQVSLDGESAIHFSQFVYP